METREHSRTPSLPESSISFGIGGRTQEVAEVASPTAAADSATWRHRSHDHLIPHMPFPIGGPLERSLSLTVSEIFDGKCDAMVDMTLNDL